MNELHSPDVYDDPAPYSQGIVHGETIFLAGQVPDDDTGAIVGDDIETQTRPAISNIEALLEAAGSSLDRIVSVTAYLTDRDDLDGFNREYAELLADPKPARATVVVEELVVDARLELQVTAVKNG
ncbi:RidA family protein [Halohasta salina]|uniref:RidA family protein n=1 Tax=Halohasta salina TaxID=2961621 RepID=UPI0020A26C98|nr:RidA family protein [Halohasta salina]